MSPEFRAGERDVSPRLVCCDCGRAAEGNVSCDEGEICDACHARDVAEPLPEISPEEYNRRIALVYTWGSWS